MVGGQTQKFLICGTLKREHHQPKDCYRPTGGQGGGGLQIGGSFKRQSKQGKSSLKGRLKKRRTKGGRPIPCGLPQRPDLPPWTAASHSRGPSRSATAQTLNRAVSKSLGCRIRTEYMPDNGGVSTDHHPGEFLNKMA